MHKKIRKKKNFLPGTLIVVLKLPGMSVMFTFAAVLKCYVKKLNVSYITFL
jgi:hypothetical protein